MSSEINHMIEIFAAFANIEIFAKMRGKPKLYTSC